MKRQINFRASDKTASELARLAKITGMNQTEVIAIAIDRMFQKEIEMEPKYTVVSDRFAQEPVDTTLDNFYKDCEELGWNRPNMTPSRAGADQYMDADTGEIILVKK